MVFSCSPNNLEQENMEMIDVFIHQPDIYYWYDAANPGQGSLEFKSEEGPYIVRVSGNLIEVDTQRPVKQVLYLRGIYGNDAVEIEILNETGFRVMITDPHPYGETFRIFF